VKQKLIFGDSDGAEEAAATAAVSGGSSTSWFDPETERRELETFLAEHQDDSVWHLLRYFLDYMFRFAVLKNLFDADTGTGTDFND
jgi:hypothetical protein